MKNKLFIIYVLTIFFTNGLQACRETHESIEHTEKITQLPEVIDFSKLTHTKCDNLDPELFKIGALAFNEAPEILSIINYFKNKLNITVAIETGIFEGCTTIALSHCFDHVFGIEISSEFITKTRNNFLQSGNSLTNVSLEEGSSPTVLEKILPQLQEKTIFFYLDSHWNDYWPILDELKIIARTHKNQCVLMIDDFLIPGFPEIKACEYKGVILSKEYIADGIREVFTNPQFHYIVPKNKMHKGKALIFSGECA